MTSSGGMTVAGGDGPATPAPTPLPGVCARPLIRPLSGRRARLGQPRPDGAFRAVRLPSQRRSRATLRPSQDPPRGREAGETPAQSRYGDRPLGDGSPVAGPRSAARTLERKGLAGMTPGTCASRPSLVPAPVTPPGRRASIPSSEVPVRLASRLAPARPPDPWRLSSSLGALLAAAAPARAPSPAPSLTAASTATTAAGHAGAHRRAAFPLTLVDDEGTAVTIASRPERIVSLTPATTEILFALGAGPGSSPRPTSTTTRRRRRACPTSPRTRASTSRRSSPSRPTSSSPAATASTPGRDRASSAASASRCSSSTRPTSTACSATSSSSGRRSASAEAGAAMTAQMRAEIDAIGDGGRRGRPHAPARLLRARRDEGDLRPGRRLLPRRDDRACRRRPDHHRQPDRLHHPARDARHGRPAGHRPRRRRLRHDARDRGRAPGWGGMTAVTTARSGR